MIYTFKKLIFRNVQLPEGIHNVISLKTGCIKMLNEFHSVERIRHPKGPVRVLRRQICREEEAAATAKNKTTQQQKTPW